MWPFMLTLLLRFMLTAGQFLTVAPTKVIYLVAITVFEIGKPTFGIASGS